MGKPIFNFDANSPSITLREAEVLLCCARGMTIQQTSEQLIISTKTVQRHRENVKERFGIRGPNQLLKWAISKQDMLGKWVNPPIV
jgi:DNA-binding CsgD family transcriptional regulator